MSQKGSLVKFPKRYVYIFVSGLYKKVLFLTFYTHLSSMSKVAI